MSPYWSLSFEAEWAYTSSFSSAAFVTDVMTREVVLLGHSHFWYTTTTKYYPVMVCDFYDRMKVEEDTQLINVAYGIMYTTSPLK